VDSLHGIVDLELVCVTFKALSKLLIVLGHNNNTSASKKAELFAKYKAAQVMNREKSLKCKGPGKMKATARAARTAILTKVLYLFQSGELPVSLVRQMKLD